MPGVVRQIGLGDGQLQIVLRQQAEVGHGARRGLDVEDGGLIAQQLADGGAVGVVSTAGAAGSEPEVGGFVSAAGGEGHDGRRQQETENALSLFHVTVPFFLQLSAAAGGHRPIRKRACPDDFRPAGLPPGSRSPRRRGEGKGRRTAERRYFRQKPQMIPKHYSTILRVRKETIFSQ